MSRPTGSISVRAAGLCILLAALTVLAPAARGQIDLRETSLALVPQQAAYYSVSWNIADQLQAVLQSSAADKIRTSFVYQMAQAQIQAMWQAGSVPAIAQFKEALAQPDNQALLQLLKDAGSNELFFYGGPETVEWLLAFTEFGQAMNRVQVEALRQGGEPQQQDVMKAVRETLDKLEGNLQIPQFVMGGRLSDQAPVDRQLERLEAWLKECLGAQPHTEDLAARVTREEWENGKLLVLPLKGSDIPWESLRQQVEEDQAPLFDAAKNLIEPLNLTLAVGQVHGYLVFSIGPDVAHLRQLGSGPVLVDHEHLAPLRQHADKPLTSAAYVSQELMARIIANSRGQSEQSIALLEAMIKQTGRVPERLESELRQDLQRLQSAWEELIPDPGAQLSFTYSVDKGYEGYRYDWAGQSSESSSQPLSLIAHRGTNPIWFVAAQAASQQADGSGLAWAAERIDYYTQEILKERNQGELEHYLQARERFLPLLKEMQTVIQEKWIPAFNGQTALVTDSGARSQQWHLAMPQSDQPLPLPRLALMWGVDDDQLALEALSDLFHIVQRMWQEVRAMAPDANEIPLESIPEPEVDERDTFTMFRYQLPAEWGLDTQQIAPNAGLSKEVFVMSLFPQQTEELMETQSGSPLPADWSVDQQAITGVAYFDWAGLIGTIEPWVNYGLAQWSNAGGADAGSNAQLVTSQVQILLDVLKSWKSYASVSYQEDQASVTRFRMQFQDVP